jgi:hypothetical protein
VLQPASWTLDPETLVLSQPMLHNNPEDGRTEVEKFICEWLEMQEPDFCHNGIFKLMLKCNKCVNMTGNYYEK